MQRDDNKTKSITMLVRTLLALTFLVVVLAIVLVYYLYSAEVVHIADQTKPFVCGTCEDLRSSRERNPNINGVDGKALFRVNCSSCHTITDKASCGPGLRGALGRIPGGDWKYHFVRDHDSMVMSGDPYSVALFEHYKTVKCTRFPKLTNNEIDAILAYASQ